MTQERNYLIDTLEAAGIRRNSIYITMKKLKAAGEYRTAAVLQVGETFERSGSKTKYVDQEGRRTTRRKLWDRKTNLRVIIADSTDDKVEEVLTEFLARLKKGIAVNGNWVDIEVNEAYWTEGEDSILRAKVAVQIDLIFHGGIYRDDTLKAMAIGDVSVERKGIDQ